MLKTMDLDYIYNTLGKDIFDFDFTFTGTDSVDKEKFKEMFKDYWLYYQIGYSTYDEFAWRFRRRLLSTIDVLNQKLTIYPKTLDLKDGNVKKTFKNNTDNKYSDTPNQPMLDTDPEGKYLTDRTNVDMSGESTEEKERNSLEKYSEIDQKIQDIIYDYIKSFKCLFITDVILYDGIIKRGL